MEDLEIRPAVLEDLPAIEAVFKSHKPELDWRFARRYYRAFFSKPEAYHGEVVLVAACGGQIAGVIGYLPDWRAAEGVYWLGWYYVHRDHRGNAVGKRLLDRVIDEVRRRGARKLYADTSSWGFYDRAHRRYQELGFTEEATLMDYYEKGEHQVIYSMDLTGALQGPPHGG